MNFKMDMMGNRRDVLRAGAASLAVLSIGSHAQSGWPVKPVTVIVPEIVAPEAGEVMLTFGLTLSLPGVVSVSAFVQAELFPAAS